MAVEFRAAARAARLEAPPLPGVPPSALWAPLRKREAELLEGGGLGPTPEGAAAATARAHEEAARTWPRATARASWRTYSGAAPIFPGVVTGTGKAPELSQELDMLMRPRCGHVRLWEREQRASLTLLTPQDACCGKNISNQKDTP